MTEAEKVQTAVDALLKLNGLIYARTLEIGSTDYFKARNIIVDTLKKLDALEPVLKPLKGLDHADQNQILAPPPSPRSQRAPRG